MKSIYVYAGVALAAIALVALGVAVVYDYGEGRFRDGRNDVLASDARAAAKLQADREALDHYSALATDTLTIAIGTQLPAIQGKTNDTIETIRTVYRDRPASDVACSRPDGVQATLNEAVDRANQAASGQL
jgi:non-canonical (house-cleaning) NTP pyrophosphatase